MMKAADALLLLLFLTAPFGYHYFCAYSVRGMIPDADPSRVRSQVRRLEMLLVICVGAAILLLFLTGTSPLAALGLVSIAWLPLFVTALLRRRLSFRHQSSPNP